MIKHLANRAPWWRRLMKSRLMIAANLLLVGFVGWSLIREAAAENRAASEHAELESRIRDLEKKNQDYSSAISKLGTTGFVEREARVKLGYQMPGEGVIMLRDPEAASAARPSAIGDELSNPRKWWRHFFADGKIMLK
jgi:cell division protein FtsB